MLLPKQQQMGVGVLKAVDTAIEADCWPVSRQNVVHLQNE